MISPELAADFARLVVIVVAAVAAVPLIRRSANRRSTFLAMGAGILLTLMPCVPHVLGAAVSSALAPAMAVLAKLDAVGFALILFGVVLSMRSMSRTDEQLRTQNSKLQEEASTDFLTGLLNRRQAELLLGYGAARARRSGDPLGFIMIDLDHFKNVNDTLGHQAGDAVLQHVGQLLRSRMRGSDIISRYGGEEFLIVLSDPNPDGVVALADDLRRLIEQNPTQYEGQQVPVTASFGVAVSPVKAESALRECVGKADAALYAAKALGRNRVVSWEESLRESSGSARDLIEQAMSTARPTKRPAIRIA